MGSGDEAGAGPGPLVLLVDDYQDAREMYLEYLKGSGFRVIEAATGEAALAIAFATPPDIIVLDLRLPDMDGWTAADRLKTDPRTRHIPVIVLTGRDAPTDPNHPHHTRCDAWLTKPCLPEALAAEILRWTGN